MPWNNAGAAVRALPLEGRLTLCNLSIELGAKMGFVASDDTTYEYLRGRRYAPKGAAFDEAVAHWRTLTSDEGAVFDREIRINAAAIAPTVTWGTSPEHAIGIGETIPDPANAPDESHREAWRNALDYMGLEPGQKIAGTKVDWVFVGSCTNSRISDLRAAAAVAQGRHVAPGVTAWVVPGSERVKRDAGERGAGPDLSRRRVRVARTRVQHVRRRQWGARATRCTVGFHLQPEFRGTAGAGCPHPFGQPGHGGGGSGHRRDYRRQEPVMQAFTTVSGTAAPLMRDNIDTDIIIRIERLTGTTKESMAKWAFEALRYRPDGSENPDFVLNQEPFRDSPILIAGGEFRLRLVPRGRRVVDDGERIALRDRIVVRGYLLQQLLPKRHASGPPVARRCGAIGGAMRRWQCPGHGRSPPASGGVPAWRGGRLRDRGDPS